MCGWRPVGKGVRDHLTGRIDTDFAISSPIVAISAMICSLRLIGSTGPNGTSVNKKGAVHSIKSGQFQSAERLTKVD